MFESDFQTGQNKSILAKLPYTVDAGFGENVKALFKKTGSLNDRNSGENPSCFRHSSPLTVTATID
jgi:hypothetical protein